MIIIINNSEKPIGQVSWTNKIKRILNTICPESNSIIVNEKDEMNYILDKNKHDIKGVILGGSELRVRQKQYLNKILDNILPIIELNVPILGICFGHQIISATYQSKICSFGEMVSGHKKIKLLWDPLFKGLGNEEYMYNAHYDYIESTPMFFKCIARDNNGIIYAIKHKYKKIYGLQFHPEFSSYGNGLQIYKNFLDMCGLQYFDLNYDEIPEVRHKNKTKFLD
tara:strand:+ start:1030 stop:1704 length:675 start_codon:yes stop_codon:yes gene_type:complete